MTLCEQIFYGPFHFRRNDGHFFIQLFRPCFGKGTTFAGQLTRGSIGHHDRIRTGFDGRYIHLHFRVYIRTSASIYNVSDRAVGPFLLTVVMCTVYAGGAVLYAGVWRWVRSEELPTL